MSGETAREESGQSVDTLKVLMDERKDWMMKLMDERRDHQKELRKGDQRNIELLALATKERLDHLNENAKRTIEERSHFVSVEAFDPFRSQVLEQLTLMNGKTQGSQITMGKIYAAIAAVGGVLTIVVLVANGVFR